jgi:hypothetical protein
MGQYEALKNGRARWLPPEMELIDEDARATREA